MAMKKRFCDKCKSIVPEDQICPCLKKRTASEAPIAAIKFALETDDAIEFLRLWNEGEFLKIREEWTDCPKECFIGVEVRYKG